jgi:hypothetical protein
LGYLGPKEKRVTEVTLERKLIVGYVKQLFKRPDFPKEIYVALDDGAMAFKGDVVWLTLDAEHPFDFVPMSRIDELIPNLPTKDVFLKQLGAENLENVSPDAEAAFWEEFKFEFADVSNTVKIIWE